MTAALSLLFFSLTVFGVVEVQIFGTLHAGAATAVGTALLLLMGILLVFQNPPQTSIKIGDPKRIQWFSLFACGAATVWLVLIVRNYGPPAIVYLIKGELPPENILQGLYRANLPLLAVFPTLITATTSVVILSATRTFLGVFSLVVNIACALAIIAICETRFMLVWIFLYVVLSHFYFLSGLKRIKKTTILFASVGLLALFVYTGNVRSGVTLNDARRFALANGISGRFSELPLPVHYVLLYFFAGTARGVANDDRIDAFAFELPKKLLPGPLQDNAGHPFDRLSVEFSEQQFSIDAWHTYALYFGLIGAVIFVSALLLGIWVLNTEFIQRLQNERPVSPIFFAVLVWLSIRVALLPIGDYLVDFSAIAELMFIMLAFRVAWVQPVPVVDGSSD